MNEYDDPRLVALYDTLNPLAADSAFYLGLAEELGVSSIADVGCGTGLLTCELARRGYTMTGVDPAAAMLEVARKREHGELVRWLEGDATRLGELGADLAIMTGHVAQAITGDEEWAATLAVLHRAVRPGGWVAFESRDPRAKAWEGWTPENTRRRADGVEVTVQFNDVRGELVYYEMQYAFEERVVAPGVLRFRSREKLTKSLEEAGFGVEHVYGGWDREHSGNELIFVARRVK